MGTMLYSISFPIPGRQVRYAAAIHNHNIFNEEMRIFMKDVCGWGTELLF